MNVDLSTDSPPSPDPEEHPVNDADAYIEAVADACTAAGLHVTEWWSDDIDPRDGAVKINTDPDQAADAADAWETEYLLGWDEEKGWMAGEPKDHGGELTNILWLGLGAIPDPADVADEAKRVAAGELTSPEIFQMIDRTWYRDQEDDDGFEDRLAVYQRARDGECATCRRPLSWRRIKNGLVLACAENHEARWRTYTVHDGTVTWNEETA